MTNARIERMIREVNAEPASDFVVSFLALIERFWPKVTAATAAAPRAGPPLPPVTGSGCPCDAALGGFRAHITWFTSRSMRARASRLSRRWTGAG